MKKSLSNKDHTALVADKLDTVLFVIMAFQITFTQTKEENFNLSYLHKFALYLALKKPKLLPIIRNLTALLRDLTENLIYYYIDTGSCVPAKFFKSITEV